MQAHTSPHFDTSVLITIDTQNDFTLPDAPAQIPGTCDIIPSMARLLSAFREKNLPIIHVVRLYLPDGSNADLCRRQMIENGTLIAAPGTQGSELVRELLPDPLIRLNHEALLSGEIQKIASKEFILYKPRWGMFFGTRLEPLLTELTADTLVIAGCNFPNCPRTSIYEASERDFRIVLARDAVSRLYPEGEKEMENIGVCLLTTDGIKRRIKR